MPNSIKITDTPMPFGDVRIGSYCRDRMDDEMYVMSWYIDTRTETKCYQWISVLDGAPEGDSDTLVTDPMCVPFPPRCDRFVGAFTVTVE